VRMASETPARLIGIDDRKGTLQKGKDADIVILDRDINVRCVFSHGEIVDGTDTLIH
ncbi:MAG TPA: amidohydrolase family protein, partial [Candidatus Avibacteroides avistercoris]|nr:amidohydrolase family protein [Candidatus Avibacteroides avistercoris]